MHLLCSNAYKIAMHSYLYSTWRTPSHILHYWFVLQVKVIQCRKLRNLWGFNQHTLCAYPPPKSLHRSWNFPRVSWAPSKFRAIEQQLLKGIGTWQAVMDLKCGQDERWHVFYNFIHYMIGIWRVNWRIEGVGHMSFDKLGGLSDNDMVSNWLWHVQILFGRSLPMIS